MSPILATIMVTRYSRETAFRFRGLTDGSFRKNSIMAQTGHCDRPPSDEPRPPAR